MVFRRSSVIFYRQQGVYEIVWSVLFSFATTLIVHSMKKVHENYWCSSSIACQEKRTDCVLRILLFIDKNPSYLPIILTLHFFEGQSDQGVTQLVITPFGISQSSRIVSLNWKNGRFFQSPFYFSFTFLDNTSHKFWDQSPFPHYQCCLQVSETGSWHKLRCCYSSNMLQHWVGRRWQIYFCKVGHSRISIDFFQELTWSQ